MVKIFVEIFEVMCDIDFCMLMMYSGDGLIGGWLMSNNCKVDYLGEFWFFIYEDWLMVCDIECDVNVGLLYFGSVGLMVVVGKFGMFIYVEGKVLLVCDLVCFVEYWDKVFDCWFL